MSRATFAGRMYPNGNLGVFPTGPAFDWEGDCSGGASPTTADTRITGDIVGASNGVFEVNGANLANLDVSGAMILNYGSQPQGSPVYLLHTNAGNARIHMTGNKIVAQTGGANYRGVALLGVKSLDFVGNTLDQVYNAVDVSAMTAGQVNIVGNLATGTASGFTFAGSAAGMNAGNRVSALGNNVDKPNPALDGMTLAARSSRDVSPACRLAPSPRAGCGPSFPISPARFPTAAR